MSMLVNPRRLDDVVILDLSGRITMGEGTLVLRDRIGKLLAAGHQKFLLNLADVDYIDSSGLGELVSLFTSPAAFRISCKSRSSLPYSRCSTTKPKHSKR